jgi:hypothetical protein
LVKEYAFGAGLKAHFFFELNSQHPPLQYDWRRYCILRIKILSNNRSRFMKIEIGESLLLSYLKHVKKCTFYQNNWKVSSNWADSTETPDKVQGIYDKIIKHSEFSDVFKASKLNQLIKQSEIDVIGMDAENKIYTADIAFHEAGLQYGDKIVTKDRVIKKLLRSYLTILTYFPNKKYELLFASPKVNPATEDVISEYFSILKKDFDDENTNFKYVSNENFNKDILMPTISKSIKDSDTNELFIRSIILSNLFEKRKSASLENRGRNEGDVNRYLNTNDEVEHKNTSNVIDSVSIKGVRIPLYKNTNETVQNFVKKILKILFENRLLPEREILKLKDKNYCKETLGIQYPLISDDKNIFIEKVKKDGYTKIHIRCWKDKINGYYVCSQWWLSLKELYIERLSIWIRKIYRMNLS